MKTENHLNLLGMEVKDKVTKSSGVVSSVSYDLYGCIQALITPPVAADGKRENSHWYDVNRLTITGKKPVMKVPDFIKIPGPARKPAKV